MEAREREPRRGHGSDVIPARPCQLPETPAPAHPWAERDTEGTSSRNPSPQSGDYLRKNEPSPHRREVDCPAHQSERAFSTWYPNSPLRAERSALWKKRERLGDAGSLSRHLVVVEAGRGPIGWLFVDTTKC